MRLPRILPVAALAFALGVTPTAPAGGGAADDAIADALRSGQVQRAFALAQREAEAGNAWAMGVLGNLYLTGRGPVQQDYAEAFDWLSRAAELGSSEAMNRLGEMYFVGVGRERDPGKAVIWYRRGAEAGSYGAMTNLALALLEGTGTEKDIAQGVALLKEAAEHDPVAQEKLGMLYRAGSGVPKEPAAAIPLFERAAASGSAAAMAALAQIYYRGEGVAQDIPLSCRWALLAHTRGRVDASAHVADICRPTLSQEQFAQQVEAAKAWIDEHFDAAGAFGAASQR